MDEIEKRKAVLLVRRLARGADYACKSVSAGYKGQCDEIKTHYPCAVCDAKDWVKRNPKRRPTPPKGGE